MGSSINTLVRPVFYFIEFPNWNAVFVSFPAQHVRFQVDYRCVIRFLIQNRLYIDWIKYYCFGRRVAIWLIVGKCSEEKTRTSSRQYTFKKGLADIFYDNFHCSYVLGLLDFLEKLQAGLEWVIPDPCLATTIVVNLYHRLVRICTTCPEMCTTLILHEKSNLHFFYLHCSSISKPDFRVSLYFFIFRRFVRISYESVPFYSDIFATFL